MRPRSRYEQICHLILQGMSEKCHEMPTRSSENSQLVGTECLESSLQDTDTGKLQGVCGKDKLGSIIESCTLARSEEHLKHSCR